MQYEQKRLLIVDDETKNIELAKVILKKEGYHLYFAQNGTEALTTLRTENIDVLVLDLMLPDMSGFDILRQLQMHSSQSMRVVVVSALDDSATITTAKEFEVDAFLTKPYDILTLKTALRDAAFVDLMTPEQKLKQLNEAFMQMDSAYLHSAKNEIVPLFLDAQTLNVDMSVALQYLAWFFTETKEGLVLNEQPIQTEGFTLIGHELYDYLQDRMNRLLLTHYGKTNALDVQALIAPTSRYFL